MTRSFSVLLLPFWLCLFQPRELWVHFDEATVPIPDDGRGLKFQLSRLHAEGPHPFKPIGAARFGPDGKLYAGFPKLSLIVVFSPDDHYSSKYYGNEQFGGKGEWLGNPELIQFADGRIFLSSPEEKRLLAYDAAWQPAGIYETRFGGAVVGPGELFVASSPGEGFHFYKCDREKRILRGYRLPGLAVADPTGPQIHLRVLSDWQIIAWTAGGLLYHLDEKGETTRWFQLFKSDGGAFQSLDAVLVDGSYWVLIQAQKRSSILVLDSSGGILAHWRAPFPADALDVNRRELAITLRASGVIRAWGRP